MKLNILLALSIIILASGCTSGFNSYIQTSGFTCQDICELQPHEAGINFTWNISGTFPNCKCGYGFAKSSLVFSDNFSAGTSFTLWSNNPSSCPVGIYNNSLRFLLQNTSCIGYASKNVNYLPYGGALEFDVYVPRNNSVIYPLIRLESFGYSIPIVFHNENDRAVFLSLNGISLDVDKTHHFKVELLNTTFNVYINGSHVFSMYLPVNNLIAFSFQGNSDSFSGGITTSSPRSAVYIDNIRFYDYHHIRGETHYQKSTFTCQDMCELQPHPENITWAVTGTVPECNCTYYADGLPAQPATTISLFSFKEDFESYVAGYDPDIQNSDRWEPTQYLYYTGNSFNPNTELNANVIAGKALKIYDNMGLYQLRTWLKANTTSTPGNNEIISMDIKWISGRIYISLMQNTSYPTSNPKITVIIDTDGKIKSYNGTAYADTGITMSSGVFKTINITLTNQFAHAITDGVHGAVMKNQAQWTDFMKYIIFGTAASHLPVGFGVMEVDNITVLQ